ncbi:MAG: EF-hand domain-containing protein [Candidatus Hydrogenedentes bacterium]|nr:EF-hand domain-containing protein [Candidatus Hydrogenedentota bacterium]
MNRVWAFGVLVTIVAAPAFAQGEEGHPCPPPLGRLIKAADADQNGEVTLEEFLTKFPNATEDRFNKLDKNGDGVLSKEDIPWHERARILRRLKEADTNGDGSVTLEEFMAAFPNADEAAFHRLDRNDDGVINKDDCVRIEPATPSE